MDNLYRKRPFRLFHSVIAHSHTHTPQLSDPIHTFGWATHSHFHSSTCVCQWLQFRESSLSHHLCVDSVKIVISSETFICTSSHTLVCVFTATMAEPRSAVSPPSTQPTHPHNSSHATHVLHNAHTYLYAPRYALSLRSSSPHPSRD